MPMGIAIAISFPLFGVSLRADSDWLWHPYLVTYMAVAPIVGAVVAELLKCGVLFALKRRVKMSPELASATRLWVWLGLLGRLLLTHVGHAG